MTRAHHAGLAAREAGSAQEPQVASAAFILLPSSLFRNRDRAFVGVPR
ncbi:hypothetical protein EDC64_10297 [Aquabacter spiritensis]|uniref:Uncharacterized protein n=1 Tax=Aquabacter spiritensis TaxID=933073 RepID=A0A4R3M0R2_9HYPH|nr:hypothetical protein EDC64_10297 [Aquabacter spiritensis]